MSASCRYLIGVNVQRYEDGLSYPVSGCGDDGSVELHKFPDDRHTPFVGCNVCAGHTVLQQGNAGMNFGSI